MATNFITNTASLKTTVADVRKLNAKKIFLGGEDILDLINSSSSTPTIKHANDTRETVTENDIWGPWIETMSDGTIIVHDDEVINPNASSSSAWNTSITKVKDNKAYIGDEFYANIQTENIKNGSNMFRGCTNFTEVASGDMNLQNLTNGSSMFYNCANLSSFNYNTSNLTNGFQMFYNCANLTSFSSDLSSLTDSNSMFYKCSKLNKFNVSLPRLTYGYRMFMYCSNFTSFSSDLSSLKNGNDMFYGCNNLTSFSSNLPSLLKAKWMFYGCDKLTTFSSDLSSLTNGNGMFYSCDKLTTFSSELPSLSNGGEMFEGCKNLTSFSSNLPKMTNGHSMFYNCANLESFSSDLPSLICSHQMFYNCANLESFSSNLSSLIYGSEMFYKCKLDAKSVMFIADSIKDIVAEKQLYINGTIPYVTISNGAYSAPIGFMSDGKYAFTYDDPLPYTQTYGASVVGKLTLGINVSNNADTIQQQLEDFAKAATFDTWTDLKQAFVDKGWSVTFQYGGTYDSITYGLRDGEQIIPCQIFAKLIEIEPQGVEYNEDGSVLRENFYTDEQMNSATYCNEDASSFYNIEWGHDVTDTSSYTQFDSLEDAMASWNVFPKENIITSE